jgi:thymidylate synthase ThyX
VRAFSQGFSMSQITAKIIEHSVSLYAPPMRKSAVRLATLQLTYPRFIHAELMTHRVFSRNASSSRAIPVMVMLKQVWNDPAMPIHWGQNQPGMQANSQLTGIKSWMAKKLWRGAAKTACVFAYLMNKTGLHKQVANRILEPFQLIHVIVTASEWDNFFELRAHKDAQPEIHALALAIKGAVYASTPTLRMGGPGETIAWHLPYVTQKERSDHSHNPNYLAKLSAARCARVSYLTHDGKKPDEAKDLALYDRLVGSRPLHASPIEHQAYPDTYLNGHWTEPQMHGNFKGWVQYRKQVEGQFQ